jgi:hypothetical protein
MRASVDVYAEFGAELAEVRRMGTSVWVPWSLFLVPIVAFFIAVAIGVIRDGVLAVSRKWTWVTGITRRDRGNQNSEDERDEQMAWAGWRNLGTIVPRYI